MGLNVNKSLNKALKRMTKKHPPLWKGPQVDGVSQSLLNQYLVCKERFRALVIDGMAPTGGYNVYIGYGHMWHHCEEVYASGGDWKTSLKKYATDLCSEFKLEQQAIQHWWRVCEIQFYIYVGYWKKHSDKLKTEPILQETSFKVPHTLPSGRTVFLRGKWDSVDRVKTGENKGVWLQENKTHTELKDEKIERRLKFDLQTCLYLVALGTEYDEIRGVRYNCVRRPLSGGKGTIRQKKNQTANEFYEELAGIIEEVPEEYFKRWNCHVSKTDVDFFKTRFLNPCLEELCDWYDWVTGKDTWDASNTKHYITPFGLYNTMTEKGFTDMDEYIITGSKVGLERVETLFGELENA